MLISALCDYYDVLEQKEKLPPSNYAEIGISYLVQLDESGRLVEISDYRQKKSETIKGKQKEIAEDTKRMFPERVRSTSILANFVEVRGGYLFGLEYRSENKDNKSHVLSPETKGTTEKQKMKLHLQHQDFAREVKEDFASIENPSPLVQAYISFAANWSPEEETSNPVLLGIGKDLNTSKFAFCLFGHPERMLQDDPGVIKKWEEMRSGEEEEQSSTCQCAITGQNLPVARTHNALISGKGVGILGAGINPSLVSFKPEAFLSYGHKQGENACISDLAMKKYTRALNWLLADPKHHNYLDELTLVYWAADANEADDDIMQILLLGNSGGYTADELDNTLSILLKDAEEGNISKERLELIEQNITSDTDYYIVALAPNASRIQVKFIYRQKFGKLLQNIAEHQRDLQIAGLRGTVPLWRIKKELISPKSSHPEQTDAMFVNVLRSIVQGTEYPEWLMATVVRRVKTDRDEKNQDGKEKTNSDKEKKSDKDKKYKVMRIGPVRAGIIKACIIRHTKENIDMSLDRDNTNPAYLCGRLFAVLQKIQEDSVYPQKLNHTIEDAYFSGASSNPAAIMPKIMKLSQHHMAKLRKAHPDWAVNDDRQMNEIIDKLGPEFPKTLGLYDQGRFMLGYYQQNEARFQPKKGVSNVEA